MKGLVSAGKDCQISRQERGLATCGRRVHLEGDSDGEEYERFSTVVEML